MQKTILITGATGGVAQALVKQLANEKLILVGRDLAKLNALYGENHTQIAGDCTTQSGAQDIMAQIQAKALSVDSLAHCVGNIRLGALHRMQEVDIEDCLRVNLFSAIFMLGAFVSQLRSDNKGGAAVLISSAAARIGTPNHEAVAAAKAGVEGLARSAAATYAPFNIRVNALAPGIMDTPATAKILGSDLARDIAAKQYPIGGIGSSDELANLIAWLLSDAATRVTGQTWSLDGGFASIRPMVK